jgi:large subunit ribosomal protein L25
MEINDTITLGAIVPPAGVTLLDDPETTVATLSPPRLQADPEPEIEGETERVGDAPAAPAADDAA